MRLTRRAVLVGGGALLAAPALRASAAEAPSRAHSGDRRAGAVYRDRKLDHLQRRRRSAAPRRMPRRHGRLHGGGRGNRRFLAHVRLLAGGHRRCAGDAGPSARPLLRRQGLDRRRRRPVPDRGDDPPLGGRALRPAAGPQPDRLGGEPRHPRRHEGGGPAPLYRRHHLARPPARRARGGHAPPAARFRPAHLQHRGPGGGTPPAAARDGARDRGHLQPAVPARPPAGPARGPAAARLGRRDRGLHLASVPAEVHHLASRGHGRHSGDATCRPRA